MEDVIADLKHSLIDPQGDFVTLTSVDNEAKTVVISDKELGEIKHMPKQIAKSEPEALEEEINETDYDDEPEVKKHRKKSDKPEKKKKRRAWADYCNASDGCCDSDSNHSGRRKGVRTYWK